MPQKFLVTDYETRSRADLRAVGAYEYSVHPSTEILCVAWRYGTLEELPYAKTQSWCVKLHPKAPIRLEFMDVISRANLRIAHNAGFEQVITKNVLPKHLIQVDEYPPEKWFCTAAQAATHALPRNLEDACRVLELSAQKDKEGKRLVKAHCMPRRQTKKDKREWNDDPVGLQRLTLYCERDVDAEVELFLKLPMLSEREQKIWVLNQKLNLRGMHVDRPMVKKVLTMIGKETEKLIWEARSLTQGKIESPKQTAAVKKWVEAKAGIDLPNLQAKTVSDILAAGEIDGPARRLLELRQEISKTSTAKYEVFELRSRFDGRIRDLLMYWGAHTGRDAGTGLQPHNFPRGTLKDVEGVLSVLATGDLEWVRALIDAPLVVFASALRWMIQATPGWELFCADFNAIEVRVLFWLAGHAAGLGLYIRGEDAYRDQATSIYSVRLIHVTPDQREVGKRAILGCGFGMGDDRFFDTCAQFGQPITRELAKKAVMAYRTKNRPVVLMWSNIERAAIEAVRNPGKAYTVNRTKWFVRNKFLYCELPSGRRLSYFNPDVKTVRNRWGQEKPTLHYWGVHPKTRQWRRMHTYGGALTENVVQATARDFMKDGEIRTSEAGYKTLITVHDEILSERKTGKGSLSEFEKLMAKTEEWGKGCPIVAKGWTGKRYRKG